MTSYPADLWGRLSPISVKLDDPRLIHSWEIPPKTIGVIVFGRFFRDVFRGEIDSDVISAATLVGVVWCRCPCHICWFSVKPFARYSSRSVCDGCLPTFGTKISHFALCRCSFQELARHLLNCSSRCSCSSYSFCGWALSEVINRLFTIQTTTGSQ